jgi:hypothetical protein
MIGVAGNVDVPIAKLDGDTAFNDLAAIGFGGTADLGIGIGRSLAVGAYGQYVSFTDPSSCSGCKLSTFAIGPFIRYHLVQGVRFDPWLELGLGFRSLTAEIANTKDRYSGLDWLHLRVGGDWYAISQLGFGPYVELDLGSFVKRPSGRDASVYGNFAAGIRIAFDAPGK